MRDIFELERSTEIDANHSYIVSYSHLVRFTSGIQFFTATELVALSHMVYGWMPTILSLHISEETGALEGTALILQKAKQEGSLSYDDLSQLKALVNNSMVGASKLLHFVAPEHFPIWDSKVYRFCHKQEPHQYRVNSIDEYLTYLDQLKKLSEDERFPEFHNSVIGKLGYEVTPMRAIELVMFLNAENDLMK
ncbi:MULTISPECIES: hypothetical protein [unclassified Endozoicomonas]|uniref:hypothetical protein n=1 Tax=Endozoicomonas TaxID=305899 RepID=UPI003BB5A05A